MSTMRTRRKTVIILAGAAISLAGCTGGTEQGGHGGGMQHPPAHTSAPSSGQHNQADVAFAQGMIPHHAQAVEMSQMAARQAQTPAVKDLARQIEAAQGPEIETMTGWLRAWGAPVPDPKAPGMGHGGHDMGQGMQGMMNPQEMREMSTSSGTDFDRMFLTMMIKHHEGAVTMAQSELDHGRDPAAKDLAKRIMDAQQEEIRTMRGMLPHGG